MLGVLSLCLALAFIALPVWSAPVESPLISLDATWRSQTLATPSPDSASPWRTPDFDASLWRTGLGGFATTPPSIWDGTQLLPPEAGTPWITAVFRSSFEVVDPEAIHWLLLRADYEDSLIAFINGTEVIRRSLPAGVEITPNTPASSVGRKYGEAMLLNLTPGLLQPGTNLLVVEIHKSSETDPSAAFKGELLANFQRDPSIHNLSSNSVTITWQTPLPSSGIIHYNPENQPSTQTPSPTTGTIHTVTLTNLQSDMTYTYWVENETDGKRASTPSYRFKTLKPSGEIQFLVAGDTGTGGIYNRRVRNLIQSQPGDFVLHVGDVIYPSFTDSTVDLKHFSIFREDLHSRPLFSVFGNHDLYAGDQPYIKALHLPTNSATGTEHFYSFDHGEVHFVGLFLTQRAQAISWPQYAMEVGSPQYNWLTNDLATTTKPWKVVMGHIPLASSGGRRNDSYLGLRDQLEYQRILLPVFEQYGVQLYLAGHDHIYERLGPMQGVHALVCGGGGYSLYGLSVRDLASARFQSRYSIASITANANQLTGVALDDFYREIDRFVINRQPPPSTVPIPPWHTPATPNGVDDGDGNFTGQRFDFPETTATAIAGLSSNLGEFCVTADADNLHLGFRHVMLPGSQSLVLFVEIPGVAGITSLQDLGDHQPIPTQEGVECLDALEGLSFSDFSPAIACILGDEHGDATSRSFPLADSGVDAGQGVFWLQPGFPEVLGAIFQQFNESPQSIPDPSESRADFISVSIPRSLMTEFNAQSTLAVGALAARAGAALTETKFVREVDTGFLGRSLEPGPDDGWTLQGLRIPLPEDSDEDDDQLRISSELKHGTDPLNPDTDEDGLLDGWEVAAGINPLDSSGPNGKDGDPDSDGFPNHAEQIAGTDPNDASSFLRLELTPEAGNRVFLRWFGQSGRIYRLEHAPTAEGAFETIEDPSLPREGRDQEEWFLLPLNTTNRYYRLRAELP
jgi:3',5'-cyclic AMP phosphodiesterase CpdA